MVKGQQKIQLYFNIMRKERIEKTLPILKEMLKNQGGKRIRLKEFQAIYPNLNFFRAVQKIGLMENSGTDRFPNWKWVGGKIVKGDIEFIYDYMTNKDRKRKMSL